MKLDELINEANYSFMNKYINTSEPKKGLYLFAYENARQERIEKQIEKLRAEKEELKAKGKIEEAKLVIKKIKELKVKLGQSDVGSEADSNEKNKGTDNVAKLKIINTLKGKICFLMMNYANLTSGIGLNGDKSLTNAVKVVKTKKDDEGKQELKVVGAPTTAQLTQHYNALKDAVEQLKKYDDEGKNLNMPYNRDIGHDIIAGTFIIVGNDYENADFRSLTDEEIEKYKEKLENYLNAGGQVTTYAMSDSENGKISEITPLLP